MKDFQQEQLFTELTPEQAAVVEGGKTLRLYSIQCYTENDPGSDEEPYLKVNGRLVWGGAPLGAGEWRPINLPVGFGSTALVELYESDPGNDPIISRFSTSTVTPCPVNAIVLTGNGSQYVLYYGVF